MPAKFSRIGFPCFFLLKRNGNPEVVEVDGKLAICVFTGQAMIDAFLTAKYGPESREVKLQRFNRRAELAAVLANSARQLAKQACNYIAFNPLSGRKTLYAPIKEYIATTAGKRLR